jgi:hypothetical protein
LRGAPASPCPSPDRTCAASRSERRYSSSSSSSVMAQYSLSNAIAALCSSPWLASPYPGRWVLVSDPQVNTGRSYAPTVPCYKCKFLYVLCCCRSWGRILFRQKDLPAFIESEAVLRVITLKFQLITRASYRKWHHGHTKKKTTKLNNSLDSSLARSKL